jgi:hypothetical protein
MDGKFIYIPGAGGSFQVIMDKYYNGSLIKA